MKKVVVMTTGGTIAMKYDPVTQGLIPAVSGDDLIEAVPALREIAPELGTVVLEGVLFRKSERVIKSGNYLVSLLITDNKTTICAKAFVSENKWKEIDELLKPGDGVKLRGEVQWDTFENMNTVMFKDLEKTDRAIDREDTWENGRRVELHIHSKMSLRTVRGVGYALVEEKEGR